MCRVECDECGNFDGKFLLVGWSIDGFVLRKMLSVGLFVVVVDGFFLCMVDCDYVIGFDVDDMFWYNEIIFENVYVCFCVLFV